MRKIPLNLRKELESDPFYERCCLTGLNKNVVKIEWHHNFIYAGRQVNEKWCILPLEKNFHERANQKWVRELLDKIMLNRASEETLKKYSKAVNLIALRNSLNKKYGNQENSTILQNNSEPNNITTF